VGSANDPLEDLFCRNGTARADQICEDVEFNPREGQATPIGPGTEAMKI